jgi:hypothetical protein
VPQRLQHLSIVPLRLVVARLGEPEVHIRDADLVVLHVRVDLELVGAEGGVLQEAELEVFGGEGVGATGFLM